MVDFFLNFCDVEMFFVLFYQMTKFVIVPLWRQFRAWRCPSFRGASAGQGRRFGSGWLLWIAPDPDFPCAPSVIFPRRLCVKTNRE